MKSHISLLRFHEPVVAGQGYSHFGVRGEIGVSQGGAETGPGRQKLSPVPPVPGGVPWLHGRCTQSPGLSAHRMAPASCVTLSSATSSGSGAALPEAWTEGHTRVKVPSPGQGLIPLPTPVSRTESQGQQSSRRQTGRLSSTDAALSWSSLGSRAWPPVCSLVRSCWKNVLT